MNARSLATWSLSLLLPLLALSCAGGTSDVDVTPTARMTVDAHVGKSMTSDGMRIDNISSSFKPTDTVYAVIDVPGSKEGTLNVRWVNGTDTVKEETLNITGDTKVLKTQLTPPEGGLKPGTYELQVMMNGDRLETEKFEVTPS